MFADILGHQAVRHSLEHGIRASRFPPALLLSGPEGIGKRTLAIAAARALLCAGTEPGCGECSACRRIDRSLDALPEWRREALARSDDPTRLDHRLHPDLVLVEPWKTGVKIEQVRDLVAEVISPPFEARLRVFLIDDAHTLNEPAANALLKSLEEPGPASHLMLVSAAPQSLPPTIRSRCQTLRCGPIPAGELEAHLVSRRGLDPDEARLRVALAGGSLKAALALDSDSYRERRADALRLLEGVPSVIEQIALVEKLGEGEALAETALALRALLRDTAALRAGASQAALLNRDLLPRLRPLAAGPLGAAAAPLAERTAELLLALRGNANRALFADVLLETIAAAGAPR